MKKIGNIKLIILLLVLVGIYFALDFSVRKNRSESIRSELVNLDIPLVSKIEIASPKNNVSLAKKGEEWELTLPNGKDVVASASSVSNILNTLSSIKPSRLASKKKEQWKEYQVDTAGTEVKIYQGNELTLDIILGRFSMESQQSYSSFVRLADESEVYNVKNFMAFSVPTDPNAYRDKTVARIHKDSLEKITFSYPGDSSFVLSKGAEMWDIQGEKADSTSVAKYLSSLSYLSSSQFYDQEIAAFSLVVSVVFSHANGQEIKLSGYIREGERIVHSSNNSQAYFKDGNLWDKVFVSASKF
ncbi:DUF4340 domain-containing protein [Reichenbachiella agarivorans]|uniref:DUF4340 domain-containing protein n=1 Tax=Reichenbachiella agarivorans TaxID=2979464 RepID=A0ABY6CT01_9BACT|nr:DUF4340 domain-containing protein [Reichenbachiella agarivorans]UXP31395.1 DUF4340 domain-containing protein [Reichenbachiella agarivorans]